MRVGVFGGTFDPPHLGHLILASEACEALRLDRVLWVPSAEHPFKRGRVRTPAATRAALVQAAIRGNARFQLCDLELRREGPSYTVDTLRALSAQDGSPELFLLVGADVVREMPAWKEPAEVARLATVVAITREGDGAPAGGGLQVLPLAVTRVDVSASDIRRRVAAGETIRYLVPEPVRALVEELELYRELP